MLHSHITSKSSFIDKIFAELPEGGRNGIGNCDGLAMPVAATAERDAVASRPEVDVSRLDDPLIEEAWVELQQHGHVPSPFLSWQWFSALRDCPELAADVSVLTCRSGSRIIGLLPVEQILRGGVRVVGLAGWHWTGTDHGDVIAAPSDRLLVARAMLTALARSRQWDVLDLDGLGADSALATVFDSVFSLPRFLHRPTERLPITYVSLDQDFVSSNARKKMRKDLRHAEASGGGFRKVTDPQQTVELLMEMMDLHVERFGDRSRVFATTARRRFHMLAAQRLSAAGLTRVHVLTQGDVSAAINYTLAWRDTLHFYSSGFRAGVGVNPGTTVRISSMLSAGAEGFRIADLLRGDHDYKHRFIAVTREDVRKRVVRPSRRLIGAATSRVSRRASLRLQDIWRRSTER